MQKEELYVKVARMTGYRKTYVNNILDTALELIADNVANGEKIYLKEFGIFEPKARAARIGRNPHTGEAVPIDATIIPSFKPSAEFKAAVKDRACMV